MAGILDIVRSELADIQAYQAPDQRPGIMLDANESPWPLPLEIRDRIAQISKSFELNRYSNSHAQELRATLAARFGGDDQEYVVGSGSDEMIALLATAFSRPRSGQAKPIVLLTRPTFVMYSVTSRCHGWDVHEVPLNAEWQLDASSTQKAFEQTRPNLAYFASPNNPTGNCFNVQTLQGLIEKFPTTLFAIDEAYAPYSNISHHDWCTRYENVAIVSTLSKVGFAAARVGWIRLHSKLAAELDKVRQPYNLNSLSQAIAVAALTEFQSFIQSSVDAVIRERTLLADALARIPGWRVYPSLANFLLVDVVNPAKVAAHLRARNIAVKSYAGSAGALGRTVRISVGTPGENAALLAALS